MGSVAEFYVIDSAKSDVRQTMDVDCVTHLKSYRELTSLEERLRRGRLDSVLHQQRRLLERTVNHGVDVRTVNYHLTQIIESGELQESATIRKIGIVQMEEAREEQSMNLDLKVAYEKAIEYARNHTPITTEPGNEHHLHPRL